MGSITHSSSGDSDGFLSHVSHSIGEAFSSSHTDSQGVAQLGDMDLGSGTTSNFYGDGQDVHAHEINASAGAEVNFKLMNLLQNLSAADDLDHEARKVIDDFGANGKLDLE